MSNIRLSKIRLNKFHWTAIALACLAFVGTVAASRLTPTRILAARAEAYFNTKTATGTQFHDLGHGVYAYQHAIDIGLILRTDEGLAVIESFDADYVEHLLAELSQRFPGEPITHLIYSHHHLDHVRGGHALQAREVIAHENTRWHFEQTANDVVLRPTRYIRGDQRLELGGRHVELLDFDHAHGEHLFAFHLPEAGILYAPDLAFCQTMPPFGFPDFNHNGHVLALERASELEFDRFVPSHFGLGDKSCITENLELYRDARSVMQRGFETHGMPVGQPSDWFVAMIEDAQAKLEPKYGHWHGYAEMSMPFLLRQLSGAFLGF